ncbi:MAG TPA: bifunctional 23S rRNA (guanine(2069)-N(7))-methyltransferase RlmK/23S rRNA (guanine(2445)-N(2))-methyltransferase RlmL [Pirellulales bacterium]|jgi:23S rRNA (guanine2445-N2)-methyltransferase / 23S rRNA (guanine2069-N7)-methyltransferase|nr:bifunctional 23S rRNA (guanine(2069)-N(7))-methyltransferase RlmK/23S rRNA (guanine(2445)-N(2))-methyltransferase RlmL [Pirellulales bacterium]
MPPLQLIATSAVGLEAVVARELKGLGYEAKIPQTGRIAFAGDESALCRANLWLRSADRVLVEVGSFEATDFGQLFDRTFALPWEQWIGGEAAFPVNGRSVKSQLSSVPACQRIVKKAIVEKLKHAHRTDSLPETGPQYTVEVALLDNRATLTIDSSGAGLHKRGYRRLVAEAQLKETLAAGLVMLSFWKADRPMIDPFCGSGTIPVEAALIGRNLAPGLNRQFAAESWPAISPRQWEEARTEARDLASPGLPVKIIGTDADEEVLSLARYHAAQAGVTDDIHFQQRDFRDLSSQRQYGCIICNPPYGERMGRDDDLEALYASMPLVLRRLKTWSHYVLTAFADFEALVGRPADRRRKLYNGRIECTYYQFHGPKPDKGRETVERGEEQTASAPSALVGQGELSVARLPACAVESTESPPRTQIRAPKRSLVPAFGGLTTKAYEQAELFARRLTTRAKHLRRWPSKRGITCYRLYDRDVPEIPLVVDRYEECLHLAEYDRPHDRSPAEHADWLDLMAKTAAETIEVAKGNVFMKRRQRQRGLNQYERFSEQGKTFTVHEGGLKFRVNLSDYLDTGLFLDHRITRSMVRNAAAGKRFLNLFGYTGAFTVYAASGGAESTTTVDLSNTYLQWAEENLGLNGLAGREHRVVRDDAMNFLKYHCPGAAYDLAVIDPPTFSNSKKTDDIWDVQRDHAELLNRLVALVSPGGVIYFSTNSRRFKLDEAALGNLAIREISRQTVPEDFRNRRIHRCWRMVAGGNAVPLAST